MKKIFFSFILTLSLSLLTACGSTGSGGNNAPTTMSPENESIVAAGVPEDRILDVIQWDDNYTVCEDTLSFINDVKTYEIRHNIDSDSCTDTVILECFADKDMNEYQFTMEITFTYSESYWSRTGDIRITSESKDKNSGYVKEITPQDIRDALATNSGYGDSLYAGGILFYFEDLSADKVTIKSKKQVDDTTLSYLVGLEMYDRGSYLNADICVDFYYHANEDKWIPSSVYNYSMNKYTPVAVGKWVGTGTDGVLEANFEIEIYDNYNVETNEYNTGKATVTTSSGTYEYIVEYDCYFSQLKDDIIVTFQIFDCISDPPLNNKYHFTCTLSENTLTDETWGTFTRQ